MASLKAIIAKFRKELRLTFQTQKNIMDVTDHYLVEIEKAASGGGGSTVEVTQIQSTGTKIATITVDDVATDLYSPNDGSGGSADDVSYDNTTSGLTADNVQDAIDETLTLIGGVASDVGDLSDLETTVKTDIVSAINEVAGSSGGFTYELVHSSNISITDNGSVTISLTKKYTNPYLFACSALPATSWGGLIYVTNVTYDSTNDTLSFTTFTNGQQVYTGVDWFIFEQ